MKNGAKSLRQIAERRIEQYIRDHMLISIDEKYDKHAKEIVDLVLDVVRKMDNDMLKLDRLMRLYLALRRVGKLPEQNRGEKSTQKAQPATRKLGEWWEPPAPSWDQWAPFADEWKV